MNIATNNENPTGALGVPQNLDESETTRQAFLGATLSADEVMAAGDRDAVHRDYVRREVIICIIANVTISFAIAMAVLHGAPAMSVWAMGGVAFGFVPQTFLIGFMITLIVSTIARSKLRSGKVPPMTSFYPELIGKVPPIPVVRALLLGGGAVLVTEPVLLTLLFLSRQTELSAIPFVIVNCLYGASLALLITPLIVRAALATPAYRGEGRSF